MLTLYSNRLSKTSLPLATSWLLAACMEAKGKQDLWTRQKTRAPGRSSPMVNHPKRGVFINSTNGKDLSHSWLILLLSRVAPEQPRVL
jgi:hypothetical protein